MVRPHFSGISRLLVAVSLVLLTASCESNKERLADYVEPDNPEVEKFKIKPLEGYRVARYSDLFSSVVSVPLETTNESLVGEITKLEILGNGDFLIFDRIKSAILLFAPNGKFIRRIGRQGSGPEEYTSLDDVCYDSYNNQIILLDNSKGCFMRYSVDGQMVSQTKTGMFIGSFAVLDKDNLVVYLDYHDSSSNPADWYNFKVIDKAGKVKAKFLKYDKRTSFLHSCDNVFCSLDGKIYSKQEFSSSVFSVSLDKFYPKYYFDFGKNQIPTKWITEDFDNIADKIRKSNGKTYLSKVFFVKGKMMMNLVHNHVYYLYSLNQNDCKSDVYASDMINDMGLGSSIMISNVKGNKCYFAIDASRFYDMKTDIVKYKAGDNITKKDEGKITAALKKLGNKDPSTRLFLEEYMKSDIILTQRDIDMVNSIKEGDNPIIQVCTLK